MEPRREEGAFSVHIRTDALRSRHQSGKRLPLLSVVRNFSRKYGFAAGSNGQIVTPNPMPGAIHTPQGHSEDGPPAGNI